MSAIVSKNPYDLLGNDQDEDGDVRPEPTKVVDKPVQRSGKRNEVANAPAEPVGSGASERGRGGRRGGRGGQNVVPLNDGNQPRDDNIRRDVHPRATRGAHEYRGRGERGQGRGGRGFGGRFTRTARDDRQSHSGIADNEKQAAHGWGGQDGNSEWNDEKAGEAIAKAETTDEPGFTPDTGAADPAFTNGPGAPGEAVTEEAVMDPPEPEDNTKSYDQYQKELAEKRAALGGGGLTARKPNEGSKQKFPEGTAFSRNAEEENFIAGSGGKARREKANQQNKNTLALDGQYYAPADAGDRGGRGRGRGGRGRGEFRGDGEHRGEHRGGHRGEHRGEGRGEFRGGEGRGRGFGGRGRGGEFRGNRGGDRGGSRGNFNTNDESAFPALGGT